MLTKIHHAVIDGMSGAEIMGLLLDLSPEGRELPPTWTTTTAASAAPGELEMLARGLHGGAALSAAGAARAAARDAEHREHAVRDAPGCRPDRPARGGGAARRRCARTAGPERAKLVAPKTSFNGRVSAHRRFVFGQISLDEVKAVKNAHGVTVNDVVVSICAGAVRRWLLEHDELPNEPLVAQIPVSVRTGDQMGTYGNRILLMSAPLFTDIADPVLRLQRDPRRARGHEGAPPRAARPSCCRTPTTSSRPPSSRRRRSSRSGSRRAGPVGPPWNLVISNVPGPQVPLYMAGARLVANYPVSVITDGMGLNITLMSYCGQRRLRHRRRPRADARRQAADGLAEGRAGGARLSSLGVRSRAPRRRAPARRRARPGADTGRPHVVVADERSPALGEQRARPRRSSIRNAIRTLERRRCDGRTRVRISSSKNAGAR